MTPRGRFALWAAVAGLAASSLGCSSTSTCSRDEDTVDVYGWVNTDRTVFTSLYKEAGGPTPQFTHYPANRVIDFHMDLVADPLTIQPYLSFTPDFSKTVANATGNMVLIRTHTKTDIIVKNDTCSEFWIWLTASTTGEPFHQVLPDAGVDDAAAGGAVGMGGADNAGAGAADAAGAAGAE